MIWQNPWAWTGLLLLALPVLIHLLGRRSARIQPFPTLRFLSESRLQAVRRTKLTDVLLLSVRGAILLAAVAALAQPLRLTDTRARATAVQIARALVIDTSYSMRRSTATGETAAAAARREADRLGAAASASLRLETAEPARALPGAAAWLRQQPVRGEIVVVSDFQNGTLDAAALAAVPPAVGLRLEPVATVEQTGEITIVLARHAEVETVAAVQAAAAETTVTWNLRAGGTGSGAPELLAGASGRDTARAALDAALAAGLPAPADSTLPVSIVFPDYTERERVMREGGPLNRWMAAVAMRLQNDATLAEAADATGSVALAGAVPDTTRWVSLLRTPEGHPLVLAAGGDGRLWLLLRGEPASLISVALIRAAARASGPPAPPAEFDPATIPTAVLAGWQRPPLEPERPRGTNDSDGRWLWVLALALLGMETLMRRARRDSPARAAAREPRERAA